MAATTLSVGDIAIVGYITNGSPDSFSFVNLVPIGSGTVIYFTDNGWTGTQFRGSSATDGDGNENLIRFTAISDIPAGTVIRSTDTSANYTWAKSGQIGTTTAGSYADLSLSQSGEQIAAFQSTNTNNPLNSGFTAIYQIDNTGTFENATTASEGNIITGLSQASNSAVLFNNISATYAAFNLNILSSGTKAQWLAAINNSSNWTFSNLTALPTGSITVGSGTTQPDLMVSLSSPTSVTVNNSFDYTLVVSNAGNANASGISVQFTLPSGVTFNSTGGSGFTSSQNSGVVTFSGGSINASGSATLTVNVTPTTTGTLTTGTAIVDPSNTIVESNDNNNTAAAISTTVNPITPSNTAPTILADNETVIDADKITPFLSLPNNSPTATPAAFVSGVINDLTDPAKTIGIEFNVSDAETDAGSLTVTATSSNTAVVENANLTLTGTGTSRNLKINPTGVGFSDITVTVSDGNLSSSYVIKYAASAAGSTTTRFLTGTSDASSAIAIDADYMFVADDEDQTIRLYDRNDSGLPLSSFDFTSSLGLFGSSEVDIEASTKIGNIIYWIGSHSNNSSGNDRPNRERIFSTTISGTGASTTLTFGGYYQFLEDDLIAWDNTNGHGLGAGFLGLAASAANNVVPEQSNGFNIEGFTVAPNGTTGYIAFRAPNEPTTDRTKALIVPVTNFTSILNGSGGTAGSATFGAPIQLDLGGRGIRSIERNANNEYLIIAGPAGAATGTAPNDFRLYTWTGVATDAPVLRSADLTALNAGGSFETIVEVPNSLTSSTQLQFLVDNGDSDWYSNGTISKDLAQTNFQKFRSELINLGTAILPTKISEIQGTGTAATAGTYTIEGIVVGDFQGANQLGGFYLQEEDTDADGNVLTSEAIFVISSTAVNVGDKVRLTGTVVENSSTPSFNQAVITPTSVSVLATGQQALVTATVLDLPTASFGDLERYEGMLVTIPETLTVTEVFNLGRFGEVSLSANGRLPNPTNIIDPNDSPASGTSSTGNSNVAAVTAQQDLNNRSRIILDDGSSASNLSDVPYVNTTDGDLTNDTLRIGSTIAGLTGVVGFGFNNYRIQATQTPVFNYEARPTLPTVGGSLKVSTFNVLNYFNGDGLGGGFPTSRGADSAAEFSRQRAKIIAAIQSLNADVVGLVEIENDGDGANSAIADLVNGLNAAMGAGTYAFTSLANTTGSSGTDEIKVAFIYKPSAVTPVGNAVYFNDPAFTSLGRPPLAQTFSVIATGEKFTPIVNHFKSKSASGATGLDADQGDGQGAYNNTRKTQATALLNFVSQIQTASGDGDVMILGDLNAYNEEDPIDILRAAGFTKLTTATDSYVFDGQTGSLDHALVSASLVSQVTGAAKWNINSSEPIAFDYNDNVADSGEANTELRNDTSLYSATPFRSSDHDPVLVGLNLYSAIAPTNLSLSATSINENVAVNNVNNVIGTFSTTDPNVNDTFTYSFVNGVNDNATFSINGSQLLINASPNFEAKSSYNILVRTTDNSGLSFDKSLTININDVNEAPTVVSLNNQVTAIAENTSTATRIKVADIAITDDALGTNTLSVSGTDASFFEISGNALYLKANTALNFEAKTSYNVTVNVDDSTVGNTPDATANFTLNITDVNEAPTAVNLNNQVTAIAENTSTTTRIKVADIAITNDALGTNSLSVSGTDASFFEVDATGLYIKANTVLNYEAKTSYSVTVNVDDSTVGATPDATTNFTVNVTNVNEAPTVTDAGFSIEENSIFNTLIGQVVASDPDANEKITFGITSGNTDVDGNGKTAFAIDSSTGEIKVNDPSDLNFEKNPIFNLGITATDAGGLTAQSLFAVNLKNVVEPVTFGKSDSDVFTLLSEDNPKPALLVTVNSNNAKQTSEIGIFIVDDAAGTIDGIAPNQSGYAEKALSKAKVLFSIIDNQPSGFSESGLSRLLQFNDTARIRFYTINDKSATTDSVLNSKAYDKVNFSPIKDLSLTETSGGFSINFNGLDITIKPSEDTLAIGTGLQDKNEGEVLDLTQGFDTTAFSQVKAEFTVNREAAFNNFVGFYKIENAKGDIKKADGSIVSVGQSGYIQAAIAGQISGIDLTAANQSTQTSSGIFQARSIFAPFIVINGNPSAILDNNPNNDPAVYFPFLGANTDKVDHIRLLGNNTFGFEDLPSGGDLDYNDIIVKVKLTPVA